MAVTRAVTSSVEAFAVLIADIKQRISKLESVGHQHNTAASDYVRRAGDTMTGELILPGNPTSNLSAATKQYVDAGDALRVLKTGDTMTGELILPSNPTSNLSAAPKQYVDFNNALRVLKTGDTMTGNLRIEATNPEGLYVGSNSDQVTDIKSIKVQSRGYAGILLDGDTGNASGEPGGAFVKLQQDGGAVRGRVGMINSSGDNAEGGSYSGSLGNSLLVGTDGNYGVQFGTNGTVRMTLGGDGVLNLTGVLNTSGIASGASSQRIIFGESYDLYADNVGPGTSTSRLWFNGPNNGSAYIGPRAGSSLFSEINLRASNVNTLGTVNTTGRVIATQNGNSTLWSDMAHVSRSNGTRGGLGMENGTDRLQFRTAANVVFLRSAGDVVFRTLEAILINQSSRTLKQDIETWSLESRNAGAMRNDSIPWSATDVVKKLRPVTYRWTEETWFDNDLGSERRERARWRLHRYQKKKGLPLYSSDETVHVCGRDCDGSVEQPCSFYANWQRGELGFIAEEVGEVIPQITRIDMESGENTGIDHIGLIAVLTKAVQELAEKVETLEETS
jgi:hypothetical protein